MQKQALEKDGKLVALDTFTDARGAINTWLRGCDVLSVTCAPGSKRANHYHKTSGHLTIVSKGRLFYYERPVGSKECPTLTIFEVGQTVWSGPLVEHQMVFNEESEFWFFSTGCRTQEEYEKDLVRLDFDLSEEYTKLHG
jgi:quercetin dioxygenase-like cupin family protein